MIKKVLALTLLTLWFASSHEVSHAGEKKKSVQKSINGVVQEVNTSDETIIIRAKTKKGPKDIRFWTNRHTRYVGVGSLENLKEEQEVTILSQRKKKKNMAIKVAVYSAPPKKIRSRSDSFSKKRSPEGRKKDIQDEETDKDIMTDKIDNKSLIDREEVKEE